MNERLYILSIDGNRKKLYKTCMRSGFRSVYILLLACTTSTKQHELLLDFEHHFRLFLQLQWCLQARLRKYGANPTLKENFSQNFQCFRYIVYNQLYCNLGNNKEFLEYICNLHLLWISWQHHMCWLGSLTLSSLS